jgi:hypothetical protein
MPNSLARHSFKTYLLFAVSRARNLRSRLFVFSGRCVRLHHGGEAEVPQYRLRGVDELVRTLRPRRQRHVVTNSRGACR